MRQARLEAAPDAGTLWAAFRQNGDPVARERLLSRHLRLVHHTARQLHATIRSDVDLNDLVSAGTIGLLKALESYDPDRGVAFSTFAVPRIRGAILDDLRRCDHVSRGIRVKQKAILAARQELAAALERAPSDRETAEHLGIAVEQLWRWQLAVREADPVSLDRPTHEGDDAVVSRSELLPDPSPSDPDEAISREQQVQLLRDEILKLAERDRLVLSLYYFEELKLHQIASILGLTESRVSQIRSKALGTLRSRIKTRRRMA